MNVRLIGVDIEELRNALRYSGLYVVSEGDEHAVKAIPHALRSGAVETVNEVKQAMDCVEWLAERNNVTQTERGE